MESAVPKSTQTLTQPQSQIDQAPRLSARGLTMMLALVCIVPVATIIFMWIKLGPASMNTLDAGVEILHPLPESIFDIPRNKRPIPETFPSVVVTNNSDSTWKLVYIRLNKWFQFSETKHPVPPGGSIEVLLYRCRGKDGTPFDPLGQPLRNVQIFAKIESGARATYTHIVETESSQSTEVERDELAADSKPD